MHFLLIMLLTALVTGCGGRDSQVSANSSPSGTQVSQTTPLKTGQSTSSSVTSKTTNGNVRLNITEVARNLDTPWALAWDLQGRLWFTERPGRLTRLGGNPVKITGVVEQGEGGLMGLAFDRKGRTFLMYTAQNENRVVRLEPNGKQTVLVNGIDAASYHNGGRIAFGPDGMLYVSTGDAGEGSRPPESRNGKILRVNPDGGEVRVFSRGHRNAQGLCFAPDGRFLITEHGPQRGDEINVIREGFDGGWPKTVGNGIQNYTPTIAPGGCAIYNAALIPQWRGSMLFVAMKDASLRRLWFASDGSVAGEEVLLKDRFGRLRDVTVGPDGAIYLSTSNGDGYGSPRSSGDRILRLAPTS